MQNRPTVLVVKTGYPLSSRVQAYREFYRSGWRVAVVDEPLNQGAGIADVTIIANLQDFDGLIEAVCSQIGSPDAVMTFNDSGLVVATRIAEHFGCPQVAPECARMAVDKVLQHQVMEDRKIRIPSWSTAESENDVEVWWEQFSSIVVKPADRSASAGVSRVDDRTEIARAFNSAKAESSTGRVVVEECISGPEFSVESIAIDGSQHPIAVTRKSVGDPPSFIETGHSLPADITKELRQELESVATGAADAIGMTIGMCHTELMVTAQGVVLIEVNARPAGDRICDLIDAALGVNVYRLLLRQFSGERLSVDDIRGTGGTAGAIRFTPSPSGVLLSVRLRSEWESDSSVMDFGVVGEKGMTLREGSSNGDRVAHALAVGNSEQNAMVAAKRALESLAIEVSGGAQP